MYIYFYVCCKFILPGYKILRNRNYENTHVIFFSIMRYIHIYFLTQPFSNPYIIQPSAKDFISPLKTLLKPISKGYTSSIALFLIVC